MVGIEKIEKDGVDYAIVVRKNAASDKKYNFLSQDADAFQLGVNFYDAGEVIKPHYHMPRTVSTNRFGEFVVIAEGEARMTIYDLEHRAIGDWTLAAGDMVLLLAGGHGFEVLAGTKIVEIKQGPFDPKKKDKEYIAAGAAS